MGKLLTILLQKMLPSARKAHLVKFRRPNGAWVEFLLSPNKQNFKVKGSSNVYYLKGVPDIDDTTNQRVWTFLHGISNPVKLHSKHPDLVEVEKNKGNMQMQLVESDQQGYERAMLVTGNKTNNHMLLVILVVGLNLVATLIIGFMILDKLGVKFV